MRVRPSSFPPSACLAAGMTLGAFFVAGLFGCGETSAVPVRLAFEVRSAHLDDCARGRGALRFHVSEVAMIDREGGRVPVHLDVDSRWQSLSTALVALAGECPGRAPAPRNGTVFGSVEPGQYDAVEFKLAVPFAGNHANPLRAEPPLDVPSMFWTWQSGHKFLRLDLGDRWSFHLGSTGCMSASAVRAPSGQCRAPNVARVRLPARAAYEGMVIVDIDALLEGVDIAPGHNCAGQYAARESCRRLLAALGIDAETGRCVDDCAGQKVFKVDDGAH